VKRSVLTDQLGGLLAAVVAGANVHDQQLLAATLDALVVPRPPASPAGAPHLCLDKGYDSPPAEAAVVARGYQPHIRRLGEAKGDPVAGSPSHPARRWVVEIILSQDAAGET
jgi:hypothetical protein